mgnify:CR=1 FL=1
MQEKNLNKHSEMGLEDLKYLLKPVEYKNLDVEIGILRYKEIDAGSSFSVPVEVTKENSIICVNFQTTDYDIMIGLYKAQTLSKFEEKNDEIEHPHSSFVTVLPLNLVESSSSPVTISFIAKVSGYYKVVFSNEHSWVRGKSLKFSCAVLRPEPNAKVIPFDEFKRMRKGLPSAPGRN